MQKVLFRYLTKENIQVNVLKTFAVIHSITESLRV